MHVGKTKAMIFKPKRQKCNCDFKIQVNGSDIENVAQFKYLGLELNSNLSFNNHYEKICKCMINRTYLLSRYKKYFNEKWRMIFATSLIMSLLEYCLPVWGKLSEYQLQRLNNIIIKVAKSVVLNKVKITRTTESKYEILEKLNWLTVEERLVVYSVDFIKKNVINKKSSLKQCFTYFQLKPKASESQASSIRLRNEQDFIVPRMRTEFGKSAFYYRTIQIWNSLPNEIKEIEGFYKFDSRVRNHIISNRRNVFK